MPLQAVFPDVEYLQGVYSGNVTHSVLATEMNMHRNKIWLPVRKDIFFAPIPLILCCRISLLSSTGYLESLSARQHRFLHQVLEERRYFVFQFFFLFDESGDLSDIFQAPGSCSA